MPAPLVPASIHENRDVSSQLSGPAAVIDQFLKVAQVVSKFGLATIIFAFPVVMGCYGLYFLWVAVNTPQVEVPTAVVGMCLTLMGPCLTVLLLYVFTKLGLWERLLPKESAKARAEAKAA